MLITPETQADIAAIITREFRSFGGGAATSNNPIAAALKDSPASFAAGVGISDVVARVIQLEEERKEATK